MNFSSVYTQKEHKYHIFEHSILIYWLNDTLSFPRFFFFFTSNNRISWECLIGPTEYLENYPINLYYELVPVTYFDQCMVYFVFGLCTTMCWDNLFSLPHTLALAHYWHLKQFGFWCHSMWSITWVCALRRLPQHFMYPSELLRSVL